jgi:hypothetical protein
MILVFNKKAYKLESKLVETTLEYLNQDRVINEGTGIEEQIKQVAKFERINTKIAESIVVGDIILVRGDTVIKYDPFINMMDEIGKLNIKLGMQLLVNNFITLNKDTMFIKEMIFNLVSMEYINIPLNNIKIGGKK